MATPRAVSAEEIPLTGVEELLYILDSPAEPQNTRCEIELPGTLDPQRLRDAAATVADLHPRARARLRRWRPSDTRLAWELAPEFEEDPVVHVRSGTLDELLEARDEVVSRPFDLHRSPPWRIGLLEHDGRSHVLFNAHHSLMDGQAIVLFMRALAAAYAGRDAPRLRRSFAPLVDGQPEPGRARALLDVASSALQRTARVAPEGERPGAPGCHLDGVRLPADATAALDPRAILPSATATDLFLAAGVMAIDRWNRDHGVTGGRIALLHAIGMPAAPGASQFGNSWMATAIGASAPERATPERLMATIVRQRTEQSRRGQAAGIQAALGARLPLPVWAKRAATAVHPLTRQRLVETAALSNMGRNKPFDFGDGLQSDALWIDSAVRLPKGLFICPAVHDGRLHVGLRSMRAQLGRDALRRLGQLYLEVLVQLGTPHGRAA